MLDNRFRFGMAILILVFLSACLTKGLYDESSGAEVVKIRKTTDENEIAEEKKIRVLLMTDGYTNTVHPVVNISTDGEVKIVSKGTEKHLKVGETLEIMPDDPMFQDDSVYIEAIKGTIMINSISRGYGTPVYDGVIELVSTAEGIVMINELPVEDYLCRVVPSEMPAGYELEALKAQAVCARSYAYRQMESYAYPEYEAHVNDSTDFQVYNNSVSQDTTNQAVKETKGETVRYKGELVTTYYFSTSCGRTTDVGAWGTTVSEENSYLQSVNVSGEKGDFEKELPWYAWEAVVPVKTMSDLFGLNTGKDIGLLSSLEITKRGAGDVAIQLKATGEKGETVVETENKIRTALGGDGYQIKKNDGTFADSRKLLPSAFFTITKEGDCFVISGGGFGHGIGMSQNGANEMAKEGKTYKEILQLFYQSVTIE